MDIPRLDRRRLVHSSLLLGGGAAASLLLPSWARAQTHHNHHATPATTPGRGVLSGDHIALSIAQTPFTLGGKTGHAVTVNGTLPAPLIRLREGQNVRISVTNHLEEDSSIHWHGILLPFQMDGVPGVSFPGIRPHETFHYEFPVRQAGTYWYHSHSGLQEAVGLFGPLVIDPAHHDPVAYDREHVIVLSDWSFMHPHMIMTRLKQQPHYFNHDQETLASLLAGKGPSAADRMRWGRMRMSPADIADVTGATYRYLINGQDADANWTGLFNPGERVRLRMINASAMTIFNLRIPDLPMTVVNADGQNVQPIETDEIQIGVAETYDVIVAPGDAAYTFMAETIDRSGYARGTLAPRPGMAAAIPALRERPTLSMRDMGMDEGAMAGMRHGTGHAMNHSMRDGSAAPGVDLNPGVDMIAPMPLDRTNDRGLGLDNVPHRVLTYGDLEALAPSADRRPPARQIEIHLTGSMERYMWSFDGKRFSEQVEPIRLARNERVRFKLVNDTMMTHPIHLHGFFFELVNGKGVNQPRKHTVNVLPGGYVRFDLTADAPGDWAFHCHLLMHMHAGMFNVVTVRPLDGEGA